MLYIVDIGEVAKNLAYWKKWLPRVEPFYALKCCPDPILVKALAHLGVGFDCASRREIHQVIELGVPRENIILANPCKGPSHILKAKMDGVKKMTFDNLDELIKIHKYYPDAELVIRILPDDSKSTMRFGTKFGASPTVCIQLLKKAKDMKLNVVGICFNVGSGCTDPNTYIDAIRLSRTIFDNATEIGFNITFLDIGGGFPKELDTFSNIAKMIQPVILQLFPANLRIIAEPGRYFAATTHTLAVNVVSRRQVELEDSTEFLYYINDGIYGSFNCIFFLITHIQLLHL